MKFKLYDCVTEDSTTIEADSIEEIKELAEYEVWRRGWQEPYLEKVTDEARGE